MRRFNILMLEQIFAAGPIGVSPMREDMHVYLHKFHALALLALVLVLFHLTLFFGRFRTYF